MSKWHLQSDSLGNWLKALDIMFSNRGFQIQKQGCKKHRETVQKNSNVHKYLVKN